MAGLVFATATCDNPDCATKFVLVDVIENEDMEVLCPQCRQVVPDAAVQMNKMVITSKALQRMVRWSRPRVYDRPQDTQVLSD